ncbi:YfhO family protein [Nannocystis bainbridge]|uniref:YfhO family protein n=1 Tax=Nannocystis bainbridge TaxID=2995303 RepID=A0ABT5EBN9_9BACT|nr:YfhO family protein [Nannocystis bainbridge]MDC0723293.1 YfhO family protein [Nannocystis bainbridge]
MARRVLAGLGLACMYAAVFLAFHPAIVTGEAFLGWDAVNEHWGDLLVPLHALRAGELPLWHPFERGGYDFLADPQTGVLYPFNWLVWLAAAVFGEGPWVVLLKSLLHVAIGGLGTHILLARLGLSPSASSFGGLAFVLSGRVAKAKDSAGLWSPVWLPWLVLTGLELVRRPSPRTGLAFGTATAMAFLSGYPPNFFRDLVGLAPVLLVALVLVVRRLPAARRHLARVAGAGGLAVGVALGLALPNIIATLAWLPETVRDQLDFGEVVYSTARPLHLLDALAPGTWRDGAPVHYLGAVALLLAVFAVRRDALRITWAACALLFFLLACGDGSFLLPFLARHVPGFGLWRIPAQYFFGFAFFVAVLAAHGFDDLVRAEPARRRALGRRLALVFGLACLGLLVARAWSRAPASTGLAALFVALGGACLGGLLSARPWLRRAAAPAAIVVALLELKVQARQIHGITQRPPDLARDAVLAQLDDRVGWRVADDDHYRWRVGARLDVRDIFGRDSTLVTRRWRAFAARAREHANLLAAANVRWYAGGHRAAVQRTAAGQSRWTPGRPVELLHAAPLAYWTAQVELVDHEDDALARLAVLPPGRAALLEASQLDPATTAAIAGFDPTAAPVPAILDGFARNRLGFTVEAPAAGVLVVNEAWGPGWTAQVDGAAAPVLRANYLFRGLLVGPGRHAVELEYRPPRLRAALAVYAATALLVLLGLVLLPRRTSA